MQYPILASGSSWYDNRANGIAKSTFTKIIIVNSYLPTGSEEAVWNGDSDNVGTIKCYVAGTELIITGNGSGKISANENSSRLFGGQGDTAFKNVRSIVGLDVLDTSNVKSLAQAFSFMSSLTSIDLSTFKTESVTSTLQMFYNCTSLETIEGISEWSTENLNVVLSMFSGCSSLKSIDLHAWNVSKVTLFNDLFKDCSSITKINMPNLDTSNVTNYSRMFSGCSSLETLHCEGWDTSKATLMASMFEKCKVLQDPPIGGFNTSNVKDMQKMFYGCHNITSSLPIGNWDTSKVTSMYAMFSSGSNYGEEYAEDLETLDIGDWNVSSCKNMEQMFYGQRGLSALYLGKWNVSNVTSFHHTFCHCTSLIVYGTENWDLSGATTLNATFHGVANRSFDVSKWNTVNCETFSQLFEACSYLISITGLDKLETSKSKSFVEMFQNCDALEKLDLSNFDTGNADTTFVDPVNKDSGGMTNMFNGMAKLKEIKLGSKFSFTGNGSCPPAVLPTQTFAGTTGKWYSSDGRSFMASDIPSNTALSYYAVPSENSTLMFIKYGTLYDIAEAIREKNKETTSYKASEMGTAVKAISGGESEAVEWHQCPESVRNYIASVTYDPSDYSTSQIANYAPGTALVANTKPVGVAKGGTTYYNETPNVPTPFASGGTAGTLKPLDKLRWINTPYAVNVRDLGGWPCDGGTVRYGLLYRGGAVTNADRSVLVGQLGVNQDLDLRGTNEANLTESPLGSDVYYTCANNYAWYTLAADCWKTNIRVIFEAVTHGEPVYFHCTAGADRTGTLACVLEGLLGMSQSDIDKDYELTCFSTGTDTDNHSRRRNESEWQGLISQINAKSGDTFRDKCVSFVAELGFTAAEINAFRAAMIDGTPETVNPSVSVFAVTNALDGAVTDNAAAEVTQYQPYEAVISAPSGKTISSVTVKMGGVDVTADVWQGEKTELYRKVTIELSNCSTDNTMVKVIDGQSYGANITADGGYTLDGATVKITMGGTDMPNYYSGGKIAIPCVTGDIVITISAVESGGGQTDLFDKSACTINKRFSGGTNEVAANGYYISDYMPVDVAQDPLTATWMGTINSTADKIAFYDENKTALGYAYIYTSKVSSGSNPATLFGGSADAGYTNNIGYTWTGTGDAAKASYYDQIAYVRINQKVSDSALTATTDIPDHQFLV